jgi:hypothetical protein
MPQSCPQRLPFFAALACALALPLAGAGCGDDPHERHMATQVQPNAIIGLWKMTQFSRDLLKRDGNVEKDGQAYPINFVNDGWLKFDSALDDAKPGGTYESCLGTWRLDHDVMVDNVVRANIVELQLRRNTERTFKKLSLTEEGGQMRLWSVYGDPKLGEFIEYERPGSKAAPKTLFD